MLQKVQQSAHIAAIMAQATTGAEVDRGNVQMAADYLAFLMEKMHGGEWRVQIDHETGFALVARRLERRS